MDLTVKNLGNVTASNVQESLSSDSPYVDVLDGTVTIPSIAALEHFTIEDLFRVKVADLIEDGTQAQFVLTCTDGTQTWSNTFRMKLHAPVLTLADFRPMSNVGPGQSGTLLVSVRNDGSAASHYTHVELYSSSTDVTFDQTALYIWSIPAGETATAYFHFTVDGNVLMGSSYEMM